MSEQEKDELLKETKESLRLLRSIQGFLRWVGGGLLIFLLTIGWVLVSDHFDQKNLRKSVDRMEPRVEVLWYRAGSPNYQLGIKEFQDRD